MSSNSHLEKKGKRRTNMEGNRASFFSQILARFSQVKENELKATLASFFMVFILMTSYFVLRPVRDAMASDWSDGEVSTLWNLQFFISAGVVSLYSFAISKIRLKYMVPLVYCFFSFSFVAFYLLIPFLSNPVIIEKTFYVWVSLFSLFHVSVFWSFMSDIFSAEQSKRLFPVIAAGASAGAILGPSIPTLLGTTINQGELMMIAAVCLIFVVPVSLYILQLKTNELNNGKVAADLSSLVLGGKWWTGFRSVISNPRLSGIAIFILLYVFVSSFVYFEQKNLLAAFSREERAQILGGIDWVVNIVTFLMAFFLTGRIVNRCGIGISLALMPILLMSGMVILAFAPLVVVMLSLQVVRRAGNYSVTRPAREMLFTQVSNDERFKAKPVIDTVIYRGGDALSGSIFAFLTEGLSLGLMAVSLVGAFIALLWTKVAIYLGWQYQQTEQNNV